MPSDANNPISKRFTLYRNGDNGFRPVQWVYSSRYYKTFDKLMEDLDEKVPNRTPGWGAGGSQGRVLWNISGTKKIRNLEEFAQFDEDKLVIGGPESFHDVPGGYESIPAKDQAKRPENPNRPHESFREMNKRLYGDAKRTERDKIYNRTDAGKSVRFTIYRNGDEKFK